MATAAQIRRFILSSVKTRRALIEDGKSRGCYPSRKNDLAFLEAYAVEIKKTPRMAKFYVNHYQKIKNIIPPTWMNKAENILMECEAIV